MTNSDNTSTSWRIEQAGNEKMELVEEHAISRENLQSFMIYRLVTPSGESLDRQDKVSLEGTLICACGYEIALKTTIGFKGFLDAPSKFPDTCPRCHRSMMLTGETTGKESTEKQWLLVTPTTGKPGVVEMHGTPSGLPEISIEKIERVFVGTGKAKKIKQEPQSADTTTSWMEHTTLSGHTGAIADFAISHDSSFIVTASFDKTLKIWDVEEGRELITLQGHRDRINSCAISPDSTYIVSASADKTLKIWDIASGEVRTTLKGHKENVYSCATSPDSAFVVSACMDGTLKIWDTETGEERATLEGHDEPASFAISPDCTFIVSWSKGNAIRLWDASMSKKRPGFLGKKSRKNKARLTIDQTSRVYSCAISPDSAFIVSAGADKTLKIWDAVTGKIRATLTGHKDKVTSCAISPDASFIVSAGADKTLIIWDLPQNQIRESLVSHTKGIGRATISPDSSFIVSNTGDKTYKVWETATGKVHTTTIPIETIPGLFSISPDSSFLVTDTPMSLSIWDVESILLKNLDDPSPSPVEIPEKPAVEVSHEPIHDDRLPSETIKELFDRQRIDPAGKNILATVLLCEWTPAPFVWNGPGPDPYAVGSEDDATRHFRFLLSKIIPGYQPHFIPGHLMITAETLIAGREFDAGESLDVGTINPMLAVMLADILEDHGQLDDLDLGKCSALSLTGNSPATGEARIGLVVK